MGSPFSALSISEDVVGLNIEDGLAVAAMSAVDGQGRLRLKEVVWTEYNPKGTSNDIASAIRRMWRKERLGRFSVVSCLRSRALTLTRFQYPELSEEELESALQLDAEETLQAAPEDVVMDWRRNPGENTLRVLRISEIGADLGKDKQGGAIDGTLISVPREDVDEHVDILKKAALYPVATDVSCFAIANLFEKAGSRGQGAGRGDATKIQHLATSDQRPEVVCLARLGTQSADIAILYDDGSIYPRTVFVHASQAKDPTKYFADSINDVLSYYRFKLHLPDIDKLYLTGVVDDDVLGRIGAVVDLPVELWDPVSEVYGMSKSMSRRLDDAGLAVRAGVAVAMGLGI